MATWEAELAAWPPAIGESVGRALETAAEHAEAQSRREARAWAQERQTWRHAMQSQLQSLSALTERQARLIARYEAESAPWVLTWSRPRATVECRGAGGNMDWTEFFPCIAVLGLLLAMWWRLDSKIETPEARLEKLLTDNLIVLNRDIGELKGQAHTHTTNG